MLFGILIAFCFSIDSLAERSRNDSAPVIRIPLPMVHGVDPWLKGSQRDSILYLVSTFAPELTEGIDEENDELVISQSKIPSSALPAIINSFDPEGDFSFVRFRMLMGKNYLENRNTQHKNFEIPEQLDVFKKMSDFESWPKEVISLSRVKGSARIVYKSPGNSKIEIRVAETISGEVGFWSRSGFCAHNALIHWAYLMLALPYR